MYNMRVRRRFHSHVRHLKGMHSGCWVWTGKKSKDGYGLMKVKGKRGYARRVSWEIHYGPIPDDAGVYRWCLRHRDCVNPNHLFLSKVNDWLDNYYLQFEDKVHLSRFIKLSKKEVEEVRSLNRRGTLTRRQLSSQFGVGLRQINVILDGRSVYNRKYWFEPGEGSTDYYGINRALETLRKEDKAIED